MYFSVAKFMVSGTARLLFIGGKPIPNVSILTDNFGCIRMFWGGGVMGGIVGG